MQNVWRHHALHTCIIIIIVRQEKLAELTEKADELGKEYDEAYQNATDLADVLNSYDELKKIKIKIQEAEKKISRLEKKLKQKNSYWWRVVFGQILTKHPLFTSWNTDVIVEYLFWIFTCCDILTTLL